MLECSVGSFLHCVSKFRINDGLSLFVVVFQAFFLSYGLGCLTVLDTDEVRQCVIVKTLILVV